MSDNNMSMKRLPQNFRPVINKISKIPGLGDEKDYKDMVSSYNQINNILEEEGGEYYDINNVIHQYRIQNDVLPVVMRIRKLMKHRNKTVYQMATKTEHWTQCLKRLKKIAIKDTGKYVHTKVVVEAFIKTLKPYADHWMGFWTTINTDHDGNIVDVELFDAEDLRNFLDLIHNQK